MLDICVPCATGEVWQYFWQCPRYWRWEVCRGFWRENMGRIKRWREENERRSWRGRAKAEGRGRKETKGRSVYILSFELEKLGTVPPFLGKGAGSPSNTMSPGPRPTSAPSDILIHPAVRPQQTGRRLGVCPFGWGGAGSPADRKWPGPRPTSMPSFILIHPTVWPQYTNVTDMTTVR